MFINSPGGAAWDGVTIMNALRRHPARVEVTVDGLAASAASVIAMAGDHITMNRGSELMLHDAWGYAMGNAGDMRDTAAVLDKLSDSLADTYAARAGGGREKWRAVMQEETWFTAEEAVTAGLADEWVDDPKQDASDAKASFDLSRFRYRGRAHAPTPRLDPEAALLPSSSEPGEPNREDPVAMSDVLTAGLRERLGMTDASDEQLLAAVDELRKPAEPKFEPPVGTVLLDAAQLDELRAAAADGRAARAQQAAERRERTVNAAVADGRIAPASRASWLAALEQNEESTTALLGTLAKNTIPVAEIGHSDDIETEDDATYKALFGAEKEA